MINRIKRISIIIFFIIIFVECGTKTSSLTTTNDYSVEIDKDGILKKIYKRTKKDTFIVNFYNDEISLEVKRDAYSKKYYLNNLIGLYKVKQKFKSLSRMNESKTIYIDTISPNFLIKESSDYISILGLKDTVKIHDKLVVSINTLDSVFSFFKLYVIGSNNQLTLNYKNALKVKSFYRTKGVIDTLVFEKAGTYFYQGFIENYTIINESKKASVDNYFCKKIIVKDAK
jgi:hypothetical protein